MSEITNFIPEITTFILTVIVGFIYSFRWDKTKWLKKLIRYLSLIAWLLLTVVVLIITSKDLTEGYLRHFWMSTFMILWFTFFLVLLAWKNYENKWIWELKFSFEKKKYLSWDNIALDIDFDIYKTEKPWKIIIELRGMRYERIGSNSRLVPFRNVLLYLGSFEKLESNNKISKRVIFEAPTLSESDKKDIVSWNIRATYNSGIFTAYEQKWIKIVWLTKEELDAWYVPPLSLFERIKNYLT